MHLGASWFLVTIQGLVAAGAIAAPPPAPPDTPIFVTSVRVLPDDPVRDLEIEAIIGIFPVTIQATLTLSADGSMLTLATDADLDITVPFGLGDGLAGTPELTKIAGDDTTDDAIVVLSNLDIRASDQDGDPLPPNEHVPRGDASLVQPILPMGSALAFGVGDDTFPRLANDVWHTQLTAEDGSHPLPDEDDPRGTWDVAEMTLHDGFIRLRIKGEVPIDLWPDADVEVTIELRPQIVDGLLTFDVEVDSDVDTGVLGDIFGFLLGGLIGFVIGFIFGGLGGALVGAAAGAVLGVVAVEVVEAIVEGVVVRQIEARLDGDETAVLACSADQVIARELVTDSPGLVLGILDAVPRSIPIHSDMPDEFHQRQVLVTNAYTDHIVDPGGFIVAGDVRIEERFVPIPATLVDRVRTPDDAGELSQLVYEVAGQQITLELDDALERIAEGALAATPFEVDEDLTPDEVILLDGTLASVCLSPVAIRREASVITDIRFGSGLDLRTEEAIRLQRADLLLLPGLQLIDPSNAEPYYRSPANDTTDDNFESLPPF